MVLPPLYAIIDFAFFAVKPDSLKAVVQYPDPVAAVVRYGEELVNAGVTLVQFRDKSEPALPRLFLSCARELRRVTQDKATLIVNDRLDFCLASDADGVHLGQDDLSPEAARKVFDSVEAHARKRTSAERKPFLIGYSTHNLEQVRMADTLPVDYVAVGPVFATQSKAKADPVIGLQGVENARQVTRKPLVAIGGITRQNCRAVRDAGADSVAVIADLFESPGKAVADFLRILG